MKYEAESEIAYANSVMQTHSFGDRMSESVTDALRRVLGIDEQKIFRYVPIESFEKALPEISGLQDAATDAFRPYSVEHQKSLCASMGYPMMDSLRYVSGKKKLEALHDIFSVTARKAVRFWEAALVAAREGERNELPTHDDGYGQYQRGDFYNIVFDRDSNLTYRNEAGHMSDYFRYHVNSYVAREAALDGAESGNPFDPVISLYEHGAADFIFMQTREHGVEKERLSTFHLVKADGKNFIGVSMAGDKCLKYHRKWGDHYHNVRGMTDEDVEMKIIGVAETRYEPEDYS